jgi:hypothetical protein
VFAFDCLEGRLSLDGAGAAVMVAQDVDFCMVSDFAVSACATVDWGDIGAPVSSDPVDGLPDPTDPGSNDGQLPFLPLGPAPLTADGPA